MIKHLLLTMKHPFRGLAPLAGRADHHVVMFSMLPTADLLRLTPQFSRQLSAQFITAFGLNKVFVSVRPANPRRSSTSAGSFECALMRWQD
jgi:hypothetical protein